MSEVIEEDQGQRQRRKEAGSNAPTVHGASETRPARAPAKPKPQPFKGGEEFKRGTLAHAMHSSESADEEFYQRVRDIGRGLENFADRVNYLRRTFWGRTQLMRETVRPAVDKLVPQGTPRLVGRIGSTVPMGTALVEKQPVAGASAPLRVERKPVLAILDRFLGEPRKTEVPKIEVPPAAPEEKPKRPQLPALF